MTSTVFFLFFIPILAIVLLAVNFLFAPHNPYGEKDSVFECGFHSFLGQNRTQFSISFFIFALLFLLFDLEILLVYPYVVSAYINNIYGLVIMLIFFLALTLGFAFELGKNALKIDSRQMSTLFKNNINNTFLSINTSESNIFKAFYKINFKHFCVIFFTFFFITFFHYICSRYSLNNYIKVYFDVIVSILSLGYIGLDLQDLNLSDLYESDKPKSTSEIKPQYNAMDRGDDNDGSQDNSAEPGLSPSGDTTEPSDIGSDDTDAWSTDDDTVMNAFRNGVSPAQYAAVKQHQIDLRRQNDLNEVDRSDTENAPAQIAAINSQHAFMSASTRERVENLEDMLALTNNPVQNNPVQHNPVQNNPVQNNPVQNNPIQAVQAETNQAESSQAQTSQAESNQADSSQAEINQAETSAQASSEVERNKRSRSDSSELDTSNKKNKGS